MHIKRLYIGDFGILRNQTLEDLSPGLIIVGGHNRAGKTTLMKVLKHLGYGFTKAAKMPPPNVRYLVEADVVKDTSGAFYKIRLDGQSEPICTLYSDRDATEASIKDVYPLDSFTYQNLFTISLDQLARVPEGMTSREALQLHSVLLGAGLSDIAGIPQMESKFMKEARAIGGQTGNASNKGFKPYVEQIKAGIDKKKHALSQVEMYQREQERLLAGKEELRSLQSNLDLKQADFTVLEMLKSNYDIFEEIDQLTIALEQHEGSFIKEGFSLQNQNAVEAAYERYKESEVEYHEQYKLLKNTLGHKESNIDKLIPLLLENKSKLENYHSKLSGLRERWNQRQGMVKKIRNDKSLLLDRLKRLNSDWTVEDMKRIEGLSLEILEKNRLMNTVSELRGLREQLQQHLYRKDQIQTELKGLEQQKTQWQTLTPAANIKVYIWSFVISAIMGIAVYSFHQAAGLFLGLFGIAGSALLTFLRSSSQKEAHIKQRELDVSILGCRSQADSLDDKIEQLQTQQDTLVNYLSTVRQTLGITQTVGPDGILEYYRAVVDLQERIRQLHTDEQELNELSDKLGAELADIKRVLDELDSFQYEESDSVFAFDSNKYDSKDGFAPWLLREDMWHELQADLIKWHDRLNKALLIDGLASDKDALEERIRGLIGNIEDKWPTGIVSLDDLVESYLSMCESRSDYLALEQKLNILTQNLNRALSADRIKKALSLLKTIEADTEDKEDRPDFNKETAELDYFFERYHTFPTRTSLDMDFNNVYREIQDLEGQIENCKEEIQKTKGQLERLALTSELEEAHAMIQQGRADLYPVAREYAVLKAAAWLCRDIKNRFMGKMRDELLKNADGILQELTSGNYEKIIPGEELFNPDFAFTLGDGSTQASADVLSRGTKEQVFLAVRLGRIMDVKPTLPVIIDDSFVNYDPLHLRQAVSVLSRISRTHQIFLMTCHPHLVGMVAQTNPVCQYWQLENGRLTKSDEISLMKHLRT